MAQGRKILGLTAALSALVATLPAQAHAHLERDALNKDLPGAAADTAADNDFVLLPGADVDGSVYLQHESHSSHSSHGSHGSHHSSR